MDYDLAKGAEYATYIYPFIRDAMLRFRMGEEKWSVSSLTNYKMVRSMAWLYHNTKDAVNEFSKKYNCDLALAENYLKVVRGIRNQQPFYVTDEDGEETGEDVADNAGGVGVRDEQILVVLGFHVAVHRERADEIAVAPLHVQ